MSTDAVEVIPEDAEIVESGGIAAALQKTEVDAQLDAAHRYKRDVGRFLNEAKSLVGEDIEVAMSCIYTLPRDGKQFTGPSIRLAELCAYAWGNLHIGTRVIDIEEKHVVAVGVVWDLQKNIKWAAEVRRRITDKRGRRYSDDMIGVTGNAALSIAARNAIFRTIPRIYINQVYDHARSVAVGSAKTLSERRTTVVDRLLRLGLTKERVLARIEKQSVEALTLEDLEVLIGLGTAIKNKEQTVDDAFPIPEPDAPKGVLDINAFRPGEPNRGHGRERIAVGAREPEWHERTAAEEQQAQAKQDASLEKQLQDSVDALICDADDFKDIETLAIDCNVRMPQVVEHIMNTMGYVPAERLPKARKEEVTRWIQAKKR